MYIYILDLTKCVKIEMLFVYLFIIESKCDELQRSSLLSHETSYI